MDLYAYSQIGTIEEIAKANGIEVPRLRGYRLMGTESVIPEDRISEAIKAYEGHIYEKTVTSCPRFCPDSNSSEFSPATDRLERKYLIREERSEELNDGRVASWLETVGFRWELLHGKARKRLKLALKQGRKEVRRSMETFNKYAGREDVLYIHARIGGPNWAYYGGAEIARQPWFIEKVDDYFDCTYCDIYARIGGLREDG